MSIAIVIMFVVITNTMELVMTSNRYLDDLFSSSHLLTLSPSHPLTVSPFVHYRLMTKLPVSLCCPVVALQWLYPFVHYRLMTKLLV